MDLFIKYIGVYLPANDTKDTGFNRLNIYKKE